MNFDQAFTHLIGNEGNYSNDPKDPGGETMYGVTYRVARANGYTGTMQDLPLDTAKGIAKAEYWDKFQCDRFQSPLGFHVFDAAYNGGHPSQWLQQVAGVTQDGVIGEHTVDAVNALDVWKVVAQFNALRLKYWTSLGVWDTFGKGWANRAANNILLGD